MGLFEIIMTCLAWPTVQMVEFQVNRREGKVKICTDQRELLSRGEHSRNEKVLDKLIFKNLKI